MTGSGLVIRKKSQGARKGDHPEMAWRLGDRAAMEQLLSLIDWYSIMQTSTPWKAVFSAFRGVCLLPTIY